VKKGLLSKTKRKNYLFVEGADDREVFIHLLNHHGITSRDLSQRGRFKERDESFEIKNCDGFPKLLEDFRVVLKGEIENNRYGIVFDADTNVKDNWGKLSKILVNRGYDAIPSIPNDDGVIVKQEGLPIVGIWLMPNNKLPGAIEEFVSFLGPQEDELWPIAQSAVQQAISTKCNFHASYVMKAHLHTWLSWQEEPGTPMGHAITKKYLNANAPHALQLITWFRNVFEF
jgi:hypothetical protein